MSNLGRACGDHHLASLCLILSRPRQVYIPDTFPTPHDCSCGVENVAFCRATAYSLQKKITFSLSNFHQHFYVNQMFIKNFCNNGADGKYGMGQIWGSSHFCEGFHYKAPENNMGRDRFGADPIFVKGSIKKHQKIIWDGTDLAPLPSL